MGVGQTRTLRSPGGGLLYATKVLGWLPGFIVGWSRVSGYIVGASTVSVAVNWEDAMSFGRAVRRAGS